MSISPTVPGLSVSSDPAALVSGLDLTEKVALLTGATTWTLTTIPGIGLRPITVSDGPIGVRGGDDDDRAAAQFPAPSATAATWDVALQARIGTLMAAEARRKGVDVVLAPVVNLQRTPVGGRHFECFSEDPLLTASLAVAFIESIQAQGISACIKHFVGNETETDRTEYLSVIDERTLREVYLAPFEAVVEAGVWTIMAAYNGISRDGVDAPATAHSGILRDILKGEWAFDGVVISDWLATKDTVGSALGGLDLVMPGPSGPWGAALIAAVERGDVPIDVIDDKVARILLLAERVGALSGLAGVVEEFDATGSSPDPDTDGTRALLTEFAARSTVVLRNADALLPLSAESTQRIALIGPNAAKPFTQGGGSAFVKAALVADPLESLRAAMPAASVTLHRGGATELRAPLIPIEVLTTPEGDPGILIEHIGDDGTVVESAVIADPSHIWFSVDDDRTSHVRLVVDLTLADAGTHSIEVGPVGAHSITVDGLLLSQSDVVVGSEVVLNSSYSHPENFTAVVEAGPSGRMVRIEAQLQVIAAEGYGRFVRVHLHYRAPGGSVEEEIVQAVEAAAAADVAVVVVGTNPETESEGWDRPTIALPGHQNELVRRVAAANPNTVVVVNAGAPVILPWLDEVPSVLWWWLPGQEAGTSLAAVLTGAIEPSGRLPWTLPASEADVPVKHGIPVDGFVRYDEGVHVGHRGWDRRGLTPAREFGYGLGYADWEYLDLDVERASDGSAEASITVANRSERDGREVVQLYLETDDPERPVRWLAGFAIADVVAGSTAVVRVPIARRAFETWDEQGSAWILPQVAYRVRVGRSSRDLRREVVLPATA